MRLTEAIEVLKDIDYFLETVFQDVPVEYEPNYLKSLSQVIYHLRCMLDFKIYPFNIEDDIFNELYMAKRVDLPDFADTCKKIETFVEEHKIYIGKDKEELDHEIQRSCL